MLNCCFAFLGDETESDFLGALDRLQWLYEYRSARLPFVILTDCYVAYVSFATISCSNLAHHVIFGVRINLFILIVSLLL